MNTYYLKFTEQYPAYEDELLNKAFEVAEEAHAGQLRNSGEPYVVHPFEVIKILADLGLDKTSIIAGILHDVPEDTDFTIEQVRKVFGRDVAKIVDGVTKLKNIEFSSKEEREAESLRKMFLAMATDIRVIIIKLADRLHNMRTLNYKNEAKQREKAMETADIYAPIAHRLGISKVKWELEDLSLRYMHPQEYYDISSKLKDTRADRENYISGIESMILKKLDTVGIKCKIEGRPKHIYSIYNKMVKNNKTFEELYDLIAVRIIVSSIKDCYEVLGAVHTIWRPIPMRFKDYIAVPKPNMYQSLHTTLLGKDGRPFEVQIRTDEMHATAEYGIAAHWRYKQGAKSDSKTDREMAWLRELMEWQNSLKDSREFMEAIKVNLYNDSVFIFTPKGEIKDFIRGATPLDFAYSIHSQIGNKCTGAKVNGKIVPQTYDLKTGDIVSIMTSSSSKGPSRDWLGVVKTAQARNKIRQWFKKEMKEENIQKGREMLEHEAKRRGYDLHALTKSEWLKPIFSRLTIKDLNDLYSSIGYGGVSTAQVLGKLIESYKKENHEEDKERKDKYFARAAKDASSVVSVVGYNDMVARLAKCCNPLPGDEIVGYVTRGRGVSVHRVDCSNLQSTDFTEERRIDVAWVKSESGKFLVEIQIEADDRAGMVADITGKLASMGYSMVTMNVRPVENNTCIVGIKLEVNAIDELHHILNKIRSISGVWEAYRMNN